MVNPITIVIAIVVFGVLLFLKLRKGKFVDKLTKDLWNESEPTTGETIKDISVAEQTLKATAETNDKEAEKLQKESARIGDYLAEKGVVKPIVEKGKEADDKEEVK